MNQEHAQSLRSKVVSLASGAGIGQLAVILVGPLITRIYGPDAVGQYFQWFAFVAIAVTFSSLRWEYVFPSAEPDHRPALLRLAIVTTLTTAVAMLIVGGVLGLEIGGRTTAWLALATVMQVLYQVTFHWCLNTGLVRVAAKGKAAHGLSQAAGQVGFGLIAPTPLALIVGYLSGTVGGLSSMWRTWRTRGRASFAQVFAAFRRYWRTPLLVCLSGAMNAVGVQLPIIVLGLRDIELAGHFGIATRSSTAPLVLISVAISQVFLSEVAAGRRDYLAVSLQNVARRALPVLCGLTVPLVAVGPQLTTVILGNEWSEAGVILQIMAPALFMTAFSSMMALIPIAIGHARGEAVYQFVLLCIRAVVLVAFLPVSPMAAIIAYAAATVACLLGYTIWCFRIVGADLRAAVRQSRQQIGWILIACLISFAGWLLYETSQASPWWSTVVAGAAALPLLVLALRKTGARVPR